MNPNIKLPFKRFQMGPVFRDGPIKLGRYREFWQVDADIVGAKGMMAEAELIRMTFDIFKEMKVEVRMEVNNRKLLDGLLMAAGIDNIEQLEDFILTVDKLKKVGEAEVVKELESKGFGDEAIAKSLSFMKVTGDNAEKLKLCEGFVNDDL